MKTAVRKKYFLVLDIGTTGVKAIVFDSSFNLKKRVYLPLKKSFPQPGWVEQNPQELVKTSQKALRQVIKESGLSGNDFYGLGITNQRETTILWDKKTGQPVYPAIVWEDNRTKEFCQGIKKEWGTMVRKKTGLEIDSYFSASKIRWILENSAEAKRVLRKKNLLFGTVDTWLLWNFTGQHLTDYTNASRTLLFNIRTLKWDRELLKIFQIPAGLLPQVRPSRANFGRLKADVLGFSLPVMAICGDQQASFYAALSSSEMRLPRRSALGEAPRNDFCSIIKVTYGTGTFIMQDLGQRFLIKEPFFTTLVPNGQRPHYALEAKITQGGKEAEALMKKPEELKKFLRQLTIQVDRYLKLLPQKPKEIVIDGGVSRFPDLAPLQEQISGLAIKKQRIYDGTALGVALIAASAKKL